MVFQQNRGTETGNWNQADNWSYELIYQKFKDAEDYLTMAKFGCSTITEQFMFDEKVKIKTRIEALKWAKHKLEMGIRGALFGVRKPTDKDKVKEYLNTLIELEKYMLLIEEKHPDGDRQKIIVNEEMFELVYNCLMRVFTEVTDPLNKNDLIFQYKEQFDADLMQQQIEDQIVNLG